jgi:hypothetical protein
MYCMYCRYSVLLLVDRHVCIQYHSSQIVGVRYCQLVAMFASGKHDVKPCTDMWRFSLCSTRELPPRGMRF